jgi:arylsulfatase A-like enzyme
MPEYFRDAGYQTFLVGKWHLGFREPAYRPTSRGFDHFYGHLTGGIGFWDHVHGGGLDWQRNGETLREEGYSTHLMAAEIDRLIAQRDPSKPMFLYAAFNAPHLPNEAPEETIAQYAHINDPNRRVHAAMVSELDAAIGQLLATLDEQGMLENTLVWFMSDNGGLNLCPLLCWSFFAPTHWTAAVTTHPFAKERNPSTRAVRVYPQFFTGKGKSRPLVVRR